MLTLCIIILKTLLSSLMLILIQDSFILALRLKCQVQFIPRMKVYRVDSEMCELVG